MVAKHHLCIYWSRQKLPFHEARDRRCIAMAESATSVDGYIFLINFSVKVARNHLSRPGVYLSARDRVSSASHGLLHLHLCGARKPHTSPQSVAVSSMHLSVTSHVTVRATGSFDLRFRDHHICRTYDLISFASFAESFHDQTGIPTECNTALVSFSPLRHHSDSPAWGMLVRERLPSKVESQHNQSYIIKNKSKKW